VLLNLEKLRQTPLTKSVVNGTTVLADRKELFREGLFRLLESQPHIEVVSRCDNGSKAIRQAREAKPDVVLMDTYMPDCNGIETAQKIARSLPDVKVAMLTDSEEEEDLFSALKAGARGYLLKNIGVDSLVQSIDLIARGQIVVSPPLARKSLIEFASMRDEREASGAGSEADLSERETEILKLVAKGATNKEIAERLIIAENTVKVHVKNILAKLQLRNKQQAAVYAAQQGLISGIEDTET
jgi:DNA-binding NarL/FixJ family response regulator